MNLFEDVHINLFDSILGSSITWIVLALLVLMGLIAFLNSGATKRIARRSNHRNNEYYYISNQKQYNNWARKQQRHNPIKFNKPKVKFNNSNRKFK